MESEQPTQAAGNHRVVSWLAALVSVGSFWPALSGGMDARWIFLASIAVFGLAHGACDVWLPGWVAGRTMTWRFIVVFCLAYLGLAGGVLLLWRAQPGIALTGFLLLTAWHWGSADAVLTGTGSWRFNLLAWGRGLMVMAAPAAFHPQAAFQVMDSLAGAAFAALPPGRLHTLAVAVLLLGVSMQALVWAKGATGRKLLGHHLETLFLLGLFAVLAPLPAAALYFVWFHAWRHILRLCRWQSSDAANVCLRVGRFHRAALPCFVGALGLLWRVAWRWPGDLLRAYLILLSAVTLPHALLVLWLDRVEVLQHDSADGQFLRSTSSARWVPLAP